jgi:hypothetical protein
MARKRNDLLAQIEADVADDRVALSSLLQRCVALGRQSGSETMRDWARQELNGYVSTDAVPDYRHVPAALMAFITNSSGYNGRPQRFTDSVFPRQIQEIIREKVDLEVAIFTQGVGELESLVSQGAGQHEIIPPWSEFIADTLNKHNMAPNSRVAEVYWSVTNASMRGMLIRIRAALADRIAELTSLTPADLDVPDKQAAIPTIQLDEQGARQVIQFLIENATINMPAGDAMTHNFGSQFNINGTTGNVAAGSSDFTQNYTAGFDIGVVREFAEMAAEMAYRIGLDAGQQAEYAEATAELTEAVDAAADKGRMRRAVDKVMGYLKLAGSTALTRAAITAGNEAVNELDKAIHHLHP